MLFEVVSALVAGLAGTLVMSAMMQKAGVAGLVYSWVS